MESAKFVGSFGWHLLNLVTIEQTIATQRNMIHSRVQCALCNWVFRQNTIRERKKNHEKREKGNSIQIPHEHWIFECITRAAWLIKSTYSIHSFAGYNDCPELRYFLPERFVRRCAVFFYVYKSLLNNIKKSIKDLLTVEIRIRTTSCIILSKSTLHLFVFAMVQLRLRFDTLLLLRSECWSISDSRMFCCVFFYFIIIIRCVVCAFFYLCNYCSTIVEMFFL